MVAVARLVEVVERKLDEAPVWNGYLRGGVWTEARLLVGHALGVDAFDADATTRDVAPGDVDAVNRLLVERVRTGRPVPYLVGETVYDRMRLRVEVGTFVPRNALEYVFDDVVGEVAWSDEPRALDLCCGIGAVGLGIARRHPTVVVDQLDIDEQAVLVAKANAVRRRVEDRCRPQVSDLFDALPPARRYDLVTVNPPYVPSTSRDTTCREVRAEPDAAVFSDGDGLSLTRAVVARAASWLADDGLLVLEVGPAQHAELDWILAGRGRWWEHRGRPLHLVTVRRPELVR